MKRPYFKSLAPVVAAVMAMAWFSGAQAQTINVPLDTHFDAINTNSTANAIAAFGTTQFTFTVTNHGTVNDINLRLAMVHTQVGDLQVCLQSPTRNVQMFFFVGGAEATNNFQDTYFDDQGSFRITSSVPAVGPPTNVHDFAPFHGPEYNINGVQGVRYQPEFYGQPPAGTNFSQFSDFNGMDMFGTWTLDIVNVGGHFRPGYIMAPGDNSVAAASRVPLINVSGVTEAYGWSTNVIGTQLIINETAVPEPAPIALMLIGLAGFTIFSRRFAKR